jgi:hypothetical protein
MHAGCWESIIANCARSGRKSKNGCSVRAMLAQGRRERGWSLGAGRSFARAGSLRPRLRRGRVVPLGRSGSGELIHQRRQHEVGPGRLVRVPVARGIPRVAAGCVLRADEIRSSPAAPKASCSTRLCVVEWSGFAASSPAGLAGPDGAGQCAGPQPEPGKMDIFAVGSAARCCTTWDETGFGEFESLGASRAGQEQVLGLLAACNCGPRAVAVLARGPPERCSSGGGTTR